MNDLTVIHATQLARVIDRGGARRGPEQAELDLLADGAVAIRDGRIAAVGSTEAVLGDFGDDAAPILDVTGHTVLPGLIESHCHPLFKAAPHPPQADRLALSDIAGKKDGIWATVRQTRAASDDELLAQLDRVYARALAGGVTTLEVKTGYSLSVEGELRDLRLLGDSAQRTPLQLVRTFLGAHMVPLDHPDADAYVDSVVNEMLPQVTAGSLAQFADVCCDADLFEPRQIVRMLDWARTAGLPVRVHADGWGAADGWRTAVSHGATTADHLTFTAEADILEIGQADTIATLLPMAEMIYLCERRASARAFIDVDVPVAVATDYCSSIGSSSLVTTIGLAVPWFGLTPSEAIVGATLNAAYSVNAGHDRGSLDVGKRGNLTILSVPHPNDVYLALGSPIVAAVVIGGDVAWTAADGPCTALDLSTDATAGAR